MTALVDRLLPPDEVVTKSRRPVCFGMFWYVQRLDVYVDVVTNLREPAVP